MTIRSHPDVQQTIPGKSREFRLYTTEDCDYGDFNASTVTCTSWGVSYANIVGESTWTLQIYDVRSQPGESVHHDLYGSVYDTKQDANRAAFEAGVLAYMVYLED